jgi:hypothetical protein
MSFVKHVAIHNQRRCTVLFREVPDEDHMCLIAYSDDLPRLIHDELMKCVEGVLAQNTADLADVLHRTSMADGRNILEALHSEHRIKKVPNNQVLLTPNGQTKQRLDEVNKLLRDMAVGNAAAQRAADMDSNAGMASKPFNKGRDVGEPPKVTEALVAPTTGVLSDADIASNLSKQAADMEAQAKSLLAEAKRLKDEAKGLTNVNKETTRAKKATSAKTGQTA